MARPVLRAFALVFTAVAGCSSGSSGSAASAVTTSQACSDWASETCQKLQSCAPFLIQLGYGDVPTCVARRALECSPTLSLSGATLTPAGLEACIHGDQAESCADYLSNKAPSACALSGSRPVGTACASNVQCASGYCQTLGARACGTCESRSAAGGPCISDPDCEQTGLTCVNAACIPLGALGAPCSLSQPCEPVLYCTSAGTSTGACAARLAAGATCDPMADGCDATTGFYCDSTTQICSQVQMSPAGGACGTPTTGPLSLCSSNGLCESPDGAATGTCLAAAADGAPCDPLNGPNCLPPASCVDGACTIPDPTICTEKDGGIGGG